MRRTKEESLQTRKQILDAARSVFAEYGVNQASLNQVADAAKVTRGAIYHHFKNKYELFFALRNEATLPLIERMNQALEDPDADPLQAIESYLSIVVDAVLHDRETRETYTILHARCEYVGELRCVLAQMNQTAQGIEDKLGDAYRRAATDGALRAGIVPELAARESYAFVTGLIRLLAVDPRYSGDPAGARTLIAHHMAQRRS